MSALLCVSCGALGCENAEPFSASHGPTNSSMSTPTAGSQATGSATGSVGDDATGGESSTATGTGTATSGAGSSSGGTASAGATATGTALAGAQSLAGASTGGGGAGGDSGVSSTGGAAGSGGAAGGDAGAGSDARPTYVYVGSGSFTGEAGKITVYTLDRSTKTLTFVSELPAGGMAADLAVDTVRGRLFSADAIDGGVQSFSVDRQSGVPTSLGATANDNFPIFLSLTADGQHLLAASLTQGAVDVHPIDGSGKASQSLGEMLASTSVSSAVIGDQNRVFTANTDLGEIAVHAFSAGTLTPSGSGAELDSPGQLFVAGERLYAISRDADILASYFVFDDALVLDWQRPRLAESNGDGAALQVTPSGKYLYATNLDPDNSIVAYDVSGSEPVYLEHESSRGSSPVDLAVDPEEELIIVGNITSPGTLEIYSIQPDGTLQHERTEPTAVTPFSVDVVRF